MLFVPPAPYLTRIRLISDRVADPDAFPFTLPIVRDLELEFRSAVTFLVGENGSGKSTLIEAIAELCSLPVTGGGRNELASRTGPEQETPLARALRPSFRERPRHGYFFRAEHMSHFAELLDERRDDKHFRADPYANYGGRSLHTRSHGEGFLAVLSSQLNGGFMLMDEPESALSPQRQLTLLAHLAHVVREERAQLVIATHSPILLTFPNADIVSLDGPKLERVSLQETTHYQITRSILEDPQRYWKHLVNP